jgi:hypothetical protein
MEIVGSDDIKLATEEEEEKSVVSVVKPIWFLFKNGLILSIISHIHPIF